MGVRVAESDLPDQLKTVPADDLPESLRVPPEDLPGAPPAQKPGFFGGIAETILPDWNTVSTIVKAGGGNPQAAMDLLRGFFGAQKEQFTKAGEAFSQGENLEAAGRVAAGFLPGIGPAAATAGERIGQGEVARGIGNTIGILAPFGAAKGLEFAGAKVVPKAAEALRESAVKQYSKVLGPTTKENKLITQRVVPELLERRVRAATRTGLKEKAETIGTASSEALEAEYAKLPQDASVQFGPIIERIEKAKADLVVKGTDQIVREDLYKALEKVQDKVLNIATGGTAEAPTATVATTRSARQQLDKAIATKTKIFGKTGKEAVKLEAQKEAANAIRNELGKEYPEIAKINKEVKLWLDVQDVLGETLTRTASQQAPLGERAMTAVGAVGGLASGGIGKALAYGSGLKLLNKAINSTGWRTVAAVEKNRLAELLGAGKITEAGNYASKVTALRGSEPPASPASTTATAATAAGPPTTNAAQILANRAKRRGNPITQEAMDLLDDLAFQYGGKKGLPVKSKALIYEKYEEGASGKLQGTGRARRVWEGMNIDDIPILQDVPHSNAAIEKALVSRKGKIWDSIVKAAEDYVRESKAATELEGEVPF